MTAILVAKCQYEVDCSRCISLLILYIHIMHLKSLSDAVLSFFVK